MIRVVWRCLYSTSRELSKMQGQALAKSRPSEQEQERDDGMVRLSKLLTTNRVCSRRQAERVLELGLIRINGKRQYQNMLVPADSQVRLFSKNGIRQEKPVTKLWMVNKPRGYVCTQRDPQGRKTIYQLMPQSLPMTFGHIMSVGRLDYNSEGLLLMTNDNDLKGILESPETRLPRLYRVKVHGRVTSEKVLKMQSPIIIQKVTYGPLDVNISRELKTNSWLDVTLHTGKNRQIRKILQKCDLQVNKLIRIAYGPYKLGSLQHGQVMEVKIEDFLLRRLTKLTKEKLGNDKRNTIEVDIRKKAIQFAQNQQQTEQLRSNSTTSPKSLLN